MFVYGTVERTIDSFIANDLKDMGYAILKITYDKHGKRRTLQVIIERFDGKPIGIEDCAKASRQISAILDVNDPIEEAYNLEVSSAGIDRDLVKLKDFDKVKGFPANIYLLESEDGKSLSGRILGTEQGGVVLLDPECDEDSENDNAILRIEFAKIKSARVGIADSLLESVKKNKK